MELLYGYLDNFLALPLHSEAVYMSKYVTLLKTVMQKLRSHLLDNSNNARHV